MTRSAVILCSSHAIGPRICLARGTKDPRWPQRPLLDPLPCLLVGPQVRTFLDTGTRPLESQGDNYRDIGLFTYCLSKGYLGRHFGHRLLWFVRLEISAAAAQRKSAASAHIILFLRPTLLHCYHPDKQHHIQYWSRKDFTLRRLDSLGLNLSNSWNTSIWRVSFVWILLALLIGSTLSLILRLY